MRLSIAYEVDPRVEGAFMEEAEDAAYVRAERPVWRRARRQRLTPDGQEREMSTRYRTDDITLT